MARKSRKVKRSRRTKKAKYAKKRFSKNLRKNIKSKKFGRTGGTVWPWSKRTNWATAHQEATEWNAAQETAERAAAARTAAESCEELLKKERQRHRQCVDNFEAATKNWAMLERLLPGGDS